MYTNRDRQERWQVSNSFIDGPSVEKLPRIDISRGAKRKTYRYRLDDIEASEQRYLESGSHGVANQ